MRALIKKFKPALNGLVLAAQDRSVAIQLGFAVLAGLAGMGLGFVFWEWALVITLGGPGHHSGDFEHRDRAAVRLRSAQTG